MPSNSIKRRFYIGIIIIISFIIIQGSTLFWIASREQSLIQQISTTQDNYNELTNAHFSHHLWLEFIEQNIKNKNNAVKLDFSGCPVNKWLSTIDADAYDKEIINRLTRTLTELHTSAEKIANLLNNNEIARAELEYIENTLLVANDFEELIGKMEDISKENIEKYQTHLNGFKKYKIAMLIFLTSTIILASILVTYNLNKTIIKPIVRISEGMKGIEEGNFNIYIGYNTDDEIGYLTQKYNSMLEILKLEKLSQKILKYLASGYDQDYILKGIIEELTESEICKFTAIYIYDASKNLLELKNSFLFPEEANHEKSKIEKGFAWQVVSSGKTITINSPDEKWHIPVGSAKIPIKSIIGIPIKYQDYLLGVLILGSLKEFSSREINTFKRITSQLAISLNNINNYNSIQTLVNTLKTKNEDLHTQKKLAEAVLRSSTEGIASIDTDCIIKSWSVGAERITGYTASEVIGKKCSDVFCHTDSTGNTLCESEICHASRLIHERKYINGEELLLKTKSGVYLPCLISASPIIDEKNNILGAVEVFRDISEEKAARNKIEQANKAKTEFLATMSHELRTPLNAILGFSELLENKVAGELNEKQARYVQNIIYSGKHLLSLINDILDISKIESGRVEWEVETYNLTAMLNNSITMIKERAQKLGIKIQSNIDEENLKKVNGDKRKTQQIVYNLLTNAIKFTPKGGTVGLNAKLANNHIVIEVWDTGVGIPKEQQTAIFDSFVQLDNYLNRKHEGAGLGLNLVKKMTELGGGTVSVDSTLNKGSKFTVKLPL